MFNLKEKLLAKGLVSQKDVLKISKQENHAKRISSLSKQEQYLVIRKWVDNSRLNSQQINSLDDVKIFFEQENSNIGWLHVSPEISQKIKNGDAGVIAYMSNHGIQHAVVLRDVALDVGELFPEWLRLLAPKEKAHKN